MKDMKNILITGGAGFIGSSISLKLIDKGYRVTVLDNLSKQIHGEDPEQSYLYSHIKNKVNFIYGDVRNRKDWDEALKNQDAVIHLAAETGTGQSMYEIAKYTEVNIGGTALLLDILTNQKTSVKKIILSSSRAIYGEGKYSCGEHGFVYPAERKEKDMLCGQFENLCPFCNKPVMVEATDEDSMIHPASIYGLTKQVQEYMALLTGNSIKIPVVIYRYQNIYGPGQSLKNPYTGILSVFSTKLILGHDINIFEDGNESRDFVYIDDVADATVLGIKNTKADNQVFNIGSGKPVSVLKVACTLKELYNSQSKITVTGNFRIGDIRHNYADISKIKNRLNFFPRYDFEIGIKLFVEWVKKEKIDNNESYQKSLEEMKSKGLFK
jgi:dTDP-L-rhamnose 4-epimerase